MFKMPSWEAVMIFSDWSHAGPLVLLGGAAVFAIWWMERDL